MIYLLLSLYRKTGEGGQRKRKDPVATDEASVGLLKHFKPDVGGTSESGTSSGPGVKVLSKTYAEKKDKWKAKLQSAQERIAELEGRIGTVKEEDSEETKELRKTNADLASQLQVKMTQISSLEMQVKMLNERVEELKREKDRWIEMAMKK